MALPLFLPDEETVRQVITSPPFVSIQGIPNFRTVGSYAVDKDTFVKPAYFYRSADPSQITEVGKAQLRKLGIKKVFDLRSPNETPNTKAGPLEIEGIQFVHVSVATDEEFVEENVAKDLQLYATDEAEAFRQTYKRFLEIGGPAFGVVFKHIREHPDEPCLIHCVAGKDRTGIITALFLSLLGVSDEDVVKDYSLTTYGLVPAIPVLMARFKTQQVFIDNWEGALNLAKSEPQTMHDLFKILRESFGGVEEYLRTHAGLTDADIASIRQNYIVPKQ